MYKSSRSINQSHTKMAHLKPNQHWDSSSIDNLINLGHVDNKYRALVS